MKIHFILLIAIFLSLNVHSQGFDNEYEVFIGDFDNDNDEDLYIKKDPDILIISGDINIPIVLHSFVNDFVLKQNSDQTFSIVSEFSEAEIEMIESWPKADLDLFVRDIDLDGFRDLELSSLGEHINGAFDQIVYSPREQSSPPEALTPENEKYQSYFYDLTRWVLNPNYFEENAPLIVTGTEPASRVYKGSYKAGASVLAISNITSNCEADIDQNEICAVSETPPSNCIMFLEIFNNFGESVGTQQVNVCIIFDYHVFVYQPGTISFTKDYSVFDEDAKETAEILDVINEDCPALPSSGDIGSLNNILQDVLGPINILLPPIPVNVDNEFSHPQFPGDTLFNTSDPTYHHYDVLTKVCGAGEPNCNHSFISGFNVFRQFTYPSFKMAPTLTNLNGESVLVYIAVPYVNGGTTNKNNFIFPAGYIQQQQIVGGNYNGAVQNITEVLHIVYPGTISRVILDKPNGQYVFTHGVGLNRAFCSLPQDFRPINMILGFSNDFFGAKAFKQLDREMIRYFEENVQ